MGVGGPEFKRFHGCRVDASEAVGGSMFALARQTVSSRCLVLIPAEEFVKPERKNLRIAFIPKQPPQTCLPDLQPPDGYSGEKTLLPNPGDSCAEATRKMCLVILDQYGSDLPASTALFQLLNLFSELPKLYACIGAMARDMC